MNVLTVRTIGITTVMPEEQRPYEDDEDQTYPQGPDINETL